MANHLIIASKILLSCLLVNILACSEPNSDCEHYLVHDIRNAKPGFSLSNLKPKVSYIPLEFNSNCPVGRIDKLSFTHDCVLVLSNDLLYQFDRAGHFLHKIGTIGNGPGEYNSILDVSVNEKVDRIFIADYVGKKIVIYNLSGEYIGQYLYDFYALHIESIDDCLLFSLLNIFGSDVNKLIISDLAGRPVASSPNNNLFTATDNFISPKIKSFQKYKDELLFRQSFNDTIYSFEPKNKRLGVRYVFDFEEAKLPVDLLGSYEQFSREQSNYAFLDDITETNDHLFVSMVFKGKGEKYVIEKQTKKSLLVDDPEKGLYLQQEGIYFWPKWVDESNCLIDYMQTSYLLENQHSVLDIELKKIIRQMDEESNPIIVVVK